MTSSNEPKYLTSLECLGLTSAEAKAYLTLVENSILTAEVIAEKVGVQYPAIYRVLSSLEQKGWVEVATGRPKQYRARSPSLVAAEAKKSIANNIESAAAMTSTLEDVYGVKDSKRAGDLWIYKGTQAVFNKLKEITLSADEDILAVSPRPIDRSVLEKILDVVVQSPKSAKILVHQANKKDVKALGPGLRRGVHLEARFPGNNAGGTMLTHTFVFPNEREVFIINTVYKGGGLIEEKTMGLWISDADYVRVQLDDMMTPRTMSRP